MRMCILDRHILKPILRKGPALSLERARADTFPYYQISRINGRGNDGRILRVTIL